MTRLVLLFGLWLPFALGCLVAIAASFLAILMEENVYGKDVLRAMDKLLAAVLGFSGYFTLSAECGVADRAPWVQLRRILNKIQVGHCEGAAAKEGLTREH